MKKIQFHLTAAACLIAATGVFAKMSAVDTIVYYRSSVPNQAGAFCDIILTTTPSCTSGTQCARTFDIDVPGEGIYQALLYLSAITTSTTGRCTILPGFVD